MFYFLEDFDIANYADDSTPYCAGRTPNFLSIIQKNRQQFSLNGLNNYMKVNTGENHLVLSGNSRATATIGNSYIESEDEKYQV